MKQGCSCRLETNEVKISIPAWQDFGDGWKIVEQVVRTVQFKYCPICGTKFESENKGE